MKKVDFQTYKKEEFLKEFSYEYCPLVFGLKISNKCLAINDHNPCEQCWELALRDVTFADEVPEEPKEQGKDTSVLDAIDVIANYYGLESRFDLTIEESSELIQAISKYKRYQNTEVMENLIEELADVSIMIRQLMFLLRIEDRVTSKMIDKINRQLERIKKEVVGCTKK